MAQVKRLELRQEKMRGNIKAGTVLLLSAVLAVTLIAGLLIVEGTWTGSSSAAPTTDSRTHAAITLWLEGDRRGAVQLMLEGPEKLDTPMRSMKALELSESEFVKLGHRKMNRATDSNVAIGYAVPEFAQALVGTADRARADGDSDKAEDIEKRVRAMLEELAAPEHTLIIRLIGEASIKKLKQ